NARLVERIDAGYITADSARKLKEVEQLSKIELILLRNIYHQVRHISIGMRQNSSVHCALIYEINGLSCQIVQPVQIYRLLADGQFHTGFLHIHNGFKHNSGTILNKLSHGMKICGQVYGSREDSFLVFAFALAEQLFPPLGY